MYFLIIYVIWWAYFDANNSGVNVQEISFFFLNTSGTVSMFFIQWRGGGDTLISAVLPTDHVSACFILIMCICSVCTVSRKLTVQSDLYIYCK